MKRLRSKVTGLSKQKSVRATVIDVGGAYCSVRLSGRGKVLSGLSYFGAQPSAGDTVYVDYQGGVPVVKTSSESELSSTSLGGSGSSAGSGSSQAKNLESVPTSITPGGSNNQVQVNIDDVLEGYDDIRYDPETGNIFLGSGMSLAEAVALGATNTLFYARDGGSARIYQFAWHTSPPGFVGYFAHGSKASPTIIEENDEFYRIDAKIWEGYNYTTVAMFRARMMEDASPTNYGSMWEFVVGKPGTNQVVNALVASYYGWDIPIRPDSPPNPYPGFLRLLAKSDGFYVRDSAGNEVGPLGAGGGGGGGLSALHIDQAGGDNDTYGVLAGSINGVNTTFTVAQGEYVSGRLSVYLNGQLQTQGDGATDDWVEDTPGSGTIEMNTAPVTGDILTVIYQTASSLTGTGRRIDQTGGGDSYGELAGAVNGSNTTFTVSAEKYVSGTLKVYLNGQLLIQGSSEAWEETNADLGTFDMVEPPETGDLLTVEYNIPGLGSGDADTVDGYHATDIDYALVSNNDASTDVTAAELEELTDGSETTKHVHTVVTPGTNDILRYDNVADSTFAGTIATLPGGSTLTYTVSSGNENILDPASTSQLAKMRLYNTTRGDYALISDCNTGTNTITLTASVPGTWQVGDTITTVSQTVTGAGRDYCDFEITSGDLVGKSAMKLYYFYRESTTIGVTTQFNIHPFESYVAAQNQSIYAQVAGRIIAGALEVKLNSDVFSLSWGASGNTVIMGIRQVGYYV